MVEEFFQGLSLILSYVKKIVRDRWESPVRDVLLPKQLGQLRERRYMAIREAMNQSIAVPTRVLMNNLHRTASEPPTNIICVWKAVR